MSSQVKHPWRATVRTVFAAVVGGASLLPYVLASAHVDDTALGAQAIAVTAGITRVLALPQVEQFLARFVPWLTAEPTTSKEN